jgi:hypothetical protein
MQATHVENLRAAVPLTEQVRFVHEKHLAQCLLQKLLRLWIGVFNVLTYEIGSEAFNQIGRRQASHVIVHLTKLPGNGHFPSAYRSGNLLINARDENELHTWGPFEDEARWDLFQRMSMPDPAFIVRAIF